jgi:subtilase family serine protease
MAQQFAPTVRVVDRIDENRLVTLKGNTHPAANAGNDLGQVSPALPMTDLILVLSRSPEQQAAFDKFVAGQYDPNSPDFHQWLTPEQVGENFGPAQTDIATVSNWLTGHGFSVDEVTKDRMAIRFSGKASQVQSAFHTEIHNLSVKGVAHIANMSDPQIPAALGPAVTGVKALHNFFPRPLHHLGSVVTPDGATGKWQRMGSSAAAYPTQSGGVRPALGGASIGSALSGADMAAASAKPQFGISVGGQYPYLVEDVGPYDFATIYNILPLWNASTPIDGTGQMIAIAATSDIDVGQTGETGANGNNDIATFRNFFGLPTGNPANTPIRVSGNSQPLTVCSIATNLLCNQNDLVENSLDVEWSGAIAKNAQIVLVASYPASASDDNLYDSESYIVNNVANPSSPVYGVHIMNVSYGECELGNGTAGNVMYYDLWQQAAAEGIAAFVATGDSGSASCDQGGSSLLGVPYAAEFGLTVSGLASTPFDTAVGGTDFNWCPLDTAFNTECTPGSYWNSANNGNAGQSNAIGYVPEVPWNDTCSNPLTLAFLQDFASQVYTVTSGINNSEQACNFLLFYASGFRGDLQQIDPGILNLVDTVGGSGGASGCVANSSTSTTTGVCTAGATSTGATTNPDTGTAQGSIPLYNNGWIKPSWQQAAVNNIPGLPSDGVRDIPDVSFFASDGFVSSSAYLICVSAVTTCSYSTKTEPYYQEVGGTSVATPAMAGVMALINQKAGAAQGSPNAELYKLAAKQTYSNCSAKGATVGNGCYFNDIDSGTIAMPCSFSAASPNCTTTLSTFGNLDNIAILSGYAAGAGYDQATGLGSLNVANVVNAWTVTVGAATATVTVKPAQTSINSNNTLDVTVTVASSPAGGVPPTGTVTLKASGSTYSGSATISNGSATFTIPANSLPGSATGLVDTLTASYGGDGVYAPVPSSTASVTVTTIVQLTPTITVTPASKTLNSNASLNVTVAVGGTSITPTGTVKLSGGGIVTALSGTLVNGSYQFTIPANTLSSGSDILTATYSGDGSYASGSNTTTVTVTESTFTVNQPSPVLTPSTAATSAGIAPGASATAVITVAAVGGYTGTVTLTCQETTTTAAGGDGAACSIPITAVSMGGTATATVTTTAPVAELRYPNVHGNGWAGAGGGAVLAFLVFLGIPARRRSWRQMLGMLVLMAALGGLSACGGGSSGGSGGGGGSSDPGTTAGTYTFLIQATGNPSVTPAVSTTFTVTVN